MTMRIMTKLFFTVTFQLVAVTLCCVLSNVALAAEPTSNVVAPQSEYLSWNASEPYWFNQYVGVGVEQRMVFGDSNFNNPVTTTNLVLGARFFGRLEVAGNAGYLSWPAQGLNETDPPIITPRYWGLSTKWQLNRRVSFKAQWQQIHLEQKEQLLLMGVDIKLSF